MVHCMDGDLAFDGTISDSGGVLGSGASTVLFETDGASGSDASTTFLGITTSVSGVTEPVPTRTYEIDSYSGLLGRIGAGSPLDNTVAGDADGDGFIDRSYDVPLAFEDFLVLNASQTVTYATSTLFGNAAPPEPGSSEILPLLPDSLGPEAGSSSTSRRICSTKARPCGSTR